MVELCNNCFLFSCTFLSTYREMARLSGGKSLSHPALCLAQLLPSPPLSTSMTLPMSSHTTGKPPFSCMTPRCLLHCLSSPQAGELPQPNAARDAGLSGEFPVHTRETKCSLPSLSYTVPPIILTPHIQLPGNVYCHAGLSLTCHCPGLVHGLPQVSGSSQGAWQPAFYMQPAVSDMLLFTKQCFISVLLYQNQLEGQCWVSYQHPEACKAVLVKPFSCSLILRTPKHCQSAAGHPTLQSWQPLGLEILIPGTQPRV